MAAKGSGRSWQDIQLMIATSSVAVTLGLWNLLAGPDREASLERAEEQARQEALAADVQATPLAPAIAEAPMPPGETVLLLGGQAPQTRIVVQGGKGGGGGRGGGGGGGAATSTRSS